MRKRRDSATPKLAINDDLLLEPFSLTFTGIRDMGHRLLIKSEVVAVETGDTIDLSFSVAISPEIDGESRAKLIRMALLRALEHELDECLRFIDGEPVQDPHPIHPRTF